MSQEHKDLVVGATEQIRNQHDISAIEHYISSDNPANGADCLADPVAAPSTSFVSADGPLRNGTETHPNHAGDMPSLHLNADGTAVAEFGLDRVS